uniref:ACB domain-containing protein n=1 Tax=Arundo donax TaxID=35708 RepID=A0A0A9E7Y4_ARUDO
MEVLDVVGLEKGRSQDVIVKQRDLGAEVAPIEVLDARSEKQRVQVVEVAEVLPLKTEAVEVKQQHVVAEVAPAADVLDAVLEEGKSVQGIEVRPDELASETVPEEVLDVVSEKKEEQVVEVKEHKLAVEVAPEPVLDVPLAEKEYLQGQQSVEEAVDIRKEAQSKEEANCKTQSVDQPEVVPEEELVARKTDDVEVTQASSSNDKLVTESPVEEVTLQRPPEDDIEADIDFEEWEGIERSEVEKRFGAAAAFAASEAGAAALSKLNSDVQLQLQGLLKVAIDGPCYDFTQPLTLRPSSRAKWVAWQKLGNMHPEIAMEKYMNLLSETIPGWLGHETSDTKKHEAGGYSEGAILTMTTVTDQQSNQGNEDSTSIDEGRLATSPNPEKGQSSDIPAE